MKKLLIIDGHSILNRAYYGLPPLTSPEGTPIGAVYGFLNILLKFYNEEEPDYLVVTFDLSAPTFRHKMFKDYKGTRKPMDDDLRVQVPIIKDVLTAMDIDIVTKEGFEADDIIGTIAKKNASDEIKVTIVSGDKDLLQLADNNINIKTPKTSKGITTVTHYTPEKIEEEYGVTPEEFVLLKAIMGDSSDNIPGVKGVGPKTAAPIVSSYHTLENVINNIDNLGSESLKKKMREGVESMKLSFKLAEIETDAPLDFTLEDATVKNFYNPASYELFKKYNFKSMLSFFSEEDKHKNAELPEITEISSEKEFSDMIEKMCIHLNEQGCLGVSISHTEESDNIIAFLNGSFPDAIAIASDENRVYYAVCSNDLDGKTIENGFYKLVKAKESNSEANIYINDLKKASKAFTDKSVFPFDLIRDVSVAAYLNDPVSGSYLYNEISAGILGLIIPGDKELKNDPENKKKILSYDAYVSFMSGNILFDMLKQKDMDSLYFDMEAPLIRVLSDMEENGVRVDRNALKEYGLVLEKGIEVTQRSVYEEAGEEFNILSPKALGGILFDKLGLPAGKKTKTGYSTAAEVLEKLAPMYTIAAKVLEYRTLTKLKSTYADGLAAFIEKDGRIHGHFNQTVTATGRLSSTDPNLQNIPVRMELGREIRKVFIPDKDYIFLDADYSQIELRVLAHMSGDEKLIEAYNQAGDIHTMTASQVFHVPIDEVTPVQRRNAKAVNFGIIYGISSFGLGKDLSISNTEAKEYIDNYFLTYPGIKHFLDKLVKDAKDRGYSETLFGRRRPIPEIKARNYMVRQFGERVAMNAPIQGTAADIMKIAMLKTHDALIKERLRSRLILQVHDEILVEAYETEKERVREIITDSMMNAVSFKVPLEIEINEGMSWYDAH